VQVVVPGKPVFDVLRSISRAGFAYACTKMVCEAAGWQLVDDEPELGYLTYSMDFATGLEERRLLSVLIAESNKPPYAFVPLYCFEEYDESREPFDLAYHGIAEQLAGFFGAATRSGEYSYPHRADWSYSFAGWSLADATLVLVQDEFDIQFGMDVTLWVEPAGTPIGAPRAMCNDTEPSPPLTRPAMPVPESS
jgi:hypothetical protein